ncbi:MAG: hypothetical protein V3S41_08810 [Spirochaetia bacterium]
MSDRREMVPTKKLVKQGTTGVGGVVGGAALLILGGLPGLFGIIVGGLLALGGFGVAASSKEDRTVAGIVGGVGVLTILSGIGLGLGGTLLWISGVGLLGLGAYNLFKFIRGLRSRR